MPADVCRLRVVDNSGVSVEGIKGAGELEVMRGAGELEGMRGAGELEGISGAGELEVIKGAGELEGISGAGELEGISGAVEDRCTEGWSAGAGMIGCTDCLAGCGVRHGRFSTPSRCDFSSCGRFSTPSRCGFSSQRTVGLRVWSLASRRVRSAMNFRRAMMSSREAGAPQVPSTSFSGNSCTQLALYRGFFVRPVTRKA